ncbi:sensor histidine kinase [Glycomyces sp. TRM65418]|uniref:anti-sigma factor RsbA family regulatory protein n=1 Tax=Glycomyces sp. TRM65418 TaxID=2867006 RepID=UPI001CE506BC|nr:anti-sigma factor RsbA family regulatory protein [Glycomyces sp. TRM65418]MCC3763489.1 sensor histidine kinase [Glycomyces sp. TRM65418]QZD57475.1 sensor histidine kinase [Glycomyces sp. TRM65418]
MTAAPVPATDDPFYHPALYYAGDQEYLDGTIPFIEEALAVDAPVAVSVPGPNLALLRRALGASAARVQMLDMTEAGANPGRIIPGVLRAFADKHPDRRVHIIGEPIWASRTAAEYPACAQHEALINHAFTGRDVAILCPYDTDGLDPQVIADSLATHPVLIDGSGRRTSDDYDPDRIVAEYNRPLEGRPPSAITREFDRETVDNARWFTTSYGRGAGLAATRLIDLEIAVTELLTNSVCHGGAGGLLSIWTEQDRLVCEVSDAGHITDPLAGRRPVDGDQPYGRGLLLVNQIVDLLRTHTGPRGTTMRFHIGLPAAGAPSQRR